MVLIWIKQKQVDINMVNADRYDIIWKNEEVQAMLPCINQLLINSLLSLYLKTTTVALVVWQVIWSSIAIYI